MDWDGLRYVLALGRAGSLARAARTLAVDETTVARRIKAVERNLGAPLFRREDRGWRPTELGLEAISRAARIEALADEVQPAETMAIAGLVRITGVPILINRIVLPAVGALLAQHPALRIEFVAEPRNLSLTRREADIALRMALPEQDRAAIARRLARLDYAEYGLVGEVSEALPWIGYGTGTSHLPPARAIRAQAAESHRLAVNDAESLIAALLAGLGRSLLPCRVGDGIVGLRRYGVPTLARDLWLLTPADTRTEARIDAIIRWLEDLLAEPPRISLSDRANPITPP
jgi:DNA-binding transcriptional LysR family regulator